MFGPTKYLFSFSNPQFFFKKVGEENWLNQLKKKLDKSL